MYSKEAHLNHDHNAANKKRIGVHATEKTSKNHSKPVYIELYCTDAYIWVVFGSFLRHVNSDSFFCLLRCDCGSNVLLLSKNKLTFRIPKFWTYNGSIRI